MQGAWVRSLGGEPKMTHASWPKYNKRKNSKHFKSRKIPNSEAWQISKGGTLLFLNKQSTHLYVCSLTHWVWESWTFEMNWCPEAVPEWWLQHRLWLCYHPGFPGGSTSKGSACNAGDPGSIPGSGRSSGEGNGNPTPVFLPGKSHGQRSLVGSNPWGHEESGMTEWLMHTSIIQWCDFGQVTETLCSDFLICKMKIVSTLYGC